MLYLIDPNTTSGVCIGFCKTLCKIKPLYGVPNDTY
jgi:hypothetical protein